MSCFEFFGRLTDEIINNKEGICLTRAAVEQDARGVVDAATAVALTARKKLLQAAQQEDS
jgi:hypothetical protein